MANPVHVIEHPLVQHKLSLMRMKSTSTSAFRNLLAEVSGLLAYEVTRDLPTHQVVVDTPLTRTSVPMLDGKKIVLISILRAGTGILDGILRLLPSARVGHIGLQRDESTAIASKYYTKLPPHLTESYVLMIDPMLATGGSAVAALELLQRASARAVRMICIVAAPEGIALVEQHHPDVHIYTPAVDRGLNAHKYIVPGLGDFGDRLYGTV